MTSKEIIKQIIVKLEDDLQHYTMVDKDKVKSKMIELELEDYKQVLQDLERLEQLEIENRNNEKVVAGGVKLMNRNLELQSRLEALEKENKELWENIEKYNHKFASVERKKADLIQENEQLLVNKNVAQALAVKYKKAIEILKNNLAIEFNDDLKFIHLKEDISQSYDYTIVDIADQQDYDLLKEVLGNEMV